LIDAFLAAARAMDGIENNCWNAHLIPPGNGRTFLGKNPESKISRSARASSAPSPVRCEANLSLLSGDIARADHASRRKRITGPEFLWREKPVYFRLPAQIADGVRQRLDCGQRVPDESPAPHKFPAIARIAAVLTAHTPSNRLQSSQRQADG
jgi:hypothetical protein